MTGSAKDRVLCQVDMLEYDAFEIDLLQVARRFLVAFENPLESGWHNAYSLAAETWNESPGLSVAHYLQKLLWGLSRCRSEKLVYQNPFCPKARTLVTEDERNLLGMLHHMRRDQTPQARLCVEALTDGHMDPDVVRAGLAFSTRFSAGSRFKSRRPVLRVVG